MDPCFRIRRHEFRSDSFLGLRLGWSQRNEEIVKRESGARRMTLSEDVHKCSSSGKGSEITPSQRHRSDGVMTLIELRYLIDEVNAFGNDTVVFKILVCSSGPEE